MKPPRTSGSEPSSAKGGRNTTITLLLTMADTTWRMFTPVVLCVGIGIWIDLTFQTKPWATFAGLVIGFVGAIGLIRLQLKKVKQ